MTMMRKAAALLVLAGCGVPALAAQSALTAGAGKVEITPPVSALKPGDTIRDPLFVRAIVMRNEGGCAVLVGIDQGGISDAVAHAAIGRAAQAVRCSPGSFILSATHTHSGSTGGLGGPGEPNADRVADAIVEAVRKADGSRRSARLGYGTTKVDLNVNRDLFADNRWVQGPNEDGPSDKTLAVVELLDSKSMPIGVYVNYAMHPVHFYLSGVVSADFPGEVSRYIERRYGPDMVAIFAQGASGDQNPRLQRPYNHLLAVRTASPGADDLRITAPAPWLRDAGERNANTRSTEAMARPIPPDRLAVYRAAIQDDGELVAAEGAVIAESVINTMRFGVPALFDKVSISSAQTTFQCPGRDRLDQKDPIREGAMPPYADGDPVTLNVGMVRVGDVHFAWVNGEVYSEIASRLKRESPSAKLLVTTLANGFANSGYIYSNAAGSHLTFQVIGSRLKPGCAEDRIVNAGLDLVKMVDQ